MAIKNAEKISGIISRMAKIIEKLRLNLKAYRSKVDDLYPFRVGVNQKFEPQGLKINPLRIKEGRELLSELKEADPKASNKKLFMRAKTMIQTGKTTPIVKNIKQVLRYTK